MDQVLIEANDCSFFNLKPGEDRVIQYFLQNSSQINSFQFFPTEKNDDEVPLAEFNYSCGKWQAGRLVGEATFIFEETEYKILIKPRFGELFLFRMLEEVLNIQILETTNSFDQNQEFQHLIRKLISFIWLNMLSKANKHGLPRATISKVFQGNTLRGRLNIHKTIIPYYTNAEIVSNYREKEANESIAILLLQAYNILVKEYHLGGLNFPDNARDAVNQLESFNIRDRSISNQEYKSISYKDIYKSFKKIVDFSWDLIQRKSISNNLQSINDGYSFFIDMAEVWELYLKSILSKCFYSKGWSIRNEELIAYPGKTFRRKLIPDIIFQKNDLFIVLDAKYKSMTLHWKDVDRADFFQIHTYIHYYQQKGKVKFGGLLYPFSNEINESNFSKIYSKSLFGSENSQTAFMIYGLDLSLLKSFNSEQSRDSDFYRSELKKLFNRIESAFCNRMITLLDESNI